MEKIIKKSLALLFFISIFIYGNTQKAHTKKNLVLLGNKTTKIDTMNLNQEVSYSEVDIICSYTVTSGSPGVQNFSLIVYGNKDFGLWGDLVETYIHEIPDTIRKTKLSIIEFKSILDKIDKINLSTSTVNEIKPVAKPFVHDGGETYMSVWKKGSLKEIQDGYYSTNKGKDYATELKNYIYTLAKGKF